MMRRVGRYVAWWLAVVVVFCGKPGQASAQASRRVLLEYSADPALDCPSAAELSSSITAQLGFDPFTSEPSEQRLRVAITKLADGAEAQIEWFDRAQHSEGERRLAAGGGDCAELARSLPFALAVQVQLHASADPPAAPAAAKPPEPPKEPRRERQAPTPAPAKPQARVLLGVGALVRSGVTPGISPGLRVFGTLTRTSWSLELSAHATWPAELQRTDGTGFEARELGANLVPCLRLNPVGFCVVGTLSVLHVHGQGVDRAGSPTSATGGVGGRLQLFWPALERLGVVVQGEALAILASQDVLLNQQTAWSTAPLAFTAILDFAAIFK
jgi:hypothetical protein